MKWCSVKKYKPTRNIDVYIVITDGGQIWTANLGHHGWESDSDSEQISGVTHFCIPDPIEIEE